MVFKKILFILILPFFLYAQWTDPRPKSIQLWHLNTSFFDSLGNVVRDSVAALSADGVTIINDGTFKQRVVKYVSDLSSLAADTAGTRVIVKQFSSTVTDGGGVFVWYASGYTADSGTVFAGSSGYFVREEWLMTGAIRPEYYGAKRDGVTDDATAFQAAVNKAITLRANMLLKPGTYYVGSQIIAELNWKQQLIIEGAGVGYQGYTATRILPAGDFLWAKSNAPTSSIQLRNFAIIRDTTGAPRQYTAVKMDTTENSTLANLLIFGFEKAIDYNWCGQTSFKNLDLQYNGWGIKGGTHSDGIQIQGGFITRNTIGVEFSNSWGSVITGTEISGDDSRDTKEIAIKLNGYAVVTQIGGRHENLDSTVYQLADQGNSFVSINTSLINGGSMPIIMRSTATNSFFNMMYPNLLSYPTNGDSTIVVSNYTQCPASMISNAYQANAASNFVVYDQSSGRKMRPGMVYQNVFANASNLAADIDNRNKMFFRQRRTGTTEIGSMTFIQETNDTTVFENYLTDDNDVRYSLNSGSFARNGSARRYVSRQDVTLSSSQPFTRDTLTISANDQVYGFSVFCSINNDSLIVAKPYSYNASTGEMIATVYHKGVSGGAAKLFYVFYVQAKKEDY